jgi:hypothetical protein
MTLSTQRLLLASMLVALAACTPRTSPQAASGSTGCLPSGDGYLRVRMRGSTDLDINWRDADMQCAGGLRPQQRGLSVTFAGPAGSGRVRFVFGLDVSADASVTRNVPTNVTVIFEGKNRWYSTHGDDRCTVDELDERPLSGAHGARTRLRRVRARGFCVEPAQAIGVAADPADQLLLSRFDFAGSIEVPEEEKTG